MEGQTFKICIFSQSGLPDSEISLPLVIQSCKGIDLPIHFEAAAAFLNTQWAWKVNYIFAGTGFEHAIVHPYGKQKILFKLFSLFCCSFLKVQRNSIFCGLFCPQVILTDQVRGRTADKGECLDASMDYERDTALLHKHKLPCVVGPIKIGMDAFIPRAYRLLCLSHMLTVLPGMFCCFMHSSCQKPQQVLCTFICLLQKFAKDILIIGSVSKDRSCLIPDA